MAADGIRLTTPLGTDVLRVAAFTLDEAVSQLPVLRLELVAPNATAVDFAKLLGASFTLRLDRGVASPRDGSRIVQGICRRFLQGARGSHTTAYQAEVVPPVWLLTRRTTSRIFQNLTVPDVLTRVLAGQPFQNLISGTPARRVLTVQYRESDFAYASRLMEEDGIYYFFAYPSSLAQVQLANTSTSAGSIVNPVVSFDPARSPGTIHDWRKAQEIRAGRTTLWDHCFELPHNHLEATAAPPTSVPVGAVTHRLQLGGVNDRLELFDYPGAYGHRFDEIDAGGGAQPAELQKVFPEAARVAALRMQEETAGAITITGASTASRLAPGRRFTLSGHGHGNGEYFVTAVRHTVRSTGSTLDYANSFTCIPAALPYRPPRATPRPVIPGLQSAVVVGPAGEAVFSDKYGRVKVQFHWDRVGNRDAASSCWVRVAGLHQGTEPATGSTAQTYRKVPRVGDEVLVAFLEGDPDRPVIVGSAYNPQRMPPS